MKPSIIVSALDAERLENLLANAHPRDAARHEALLDELSRADIVAPKDVPPGVVTMNSTIRFEINELPDKLCMTLAYPKDMQTVPNGISILTPIGTALLGLSVGDSIDWPRPDGQLQTVRLLEVLYQPERAGDFFR